MPETSIPDSVSQYRLGFGTPSILIPEGWFQANSSPPTSTGKRIVGVIVPATVFAFLVVPSVNSSSAWYACIAGWCGMKALEQSSRMIRGARRRILAEKSPATHVLVFYGVPSRIYTPERSIAATAEFSGGVKLTGKGVDHSIATHRITCCEVGSFHAFGELTPGMRIDWLTDAGRENSLYLAFYGNPRQFDLEKNAADLMRGNWLSENLPQDVTWLPSSEVFEPSRRQWQLIAISTLVAVGVLEAAIALLSLSMSLVLHLLFLFWAVLIGVAIPFGAMTTRRERELLRAAKASK
ncbi:MAG TPA: hypothetical protein VK171_06820 [Fimbriimonas sp.]|nr:hypothetical protein [Fimbriimonas sp.]